MGLMNIYQIMEFSKIYKRVLNVELILKRKLIATLKLIYPNKGFNRLIPFLNNNLQHGKYVYKDRKGTQRDRVNDIINSQKTQEQKLSLFFKISYLSDTLKILINYNAIRKDKKFRANFYKNKTYNQSELEWNVARLIELRNAVMHFDYELYTNNKTEWLNCLKFWECLLDCPNCFMYKIPKKCIATKKILRFLTQNVPNFFYLNDRIICDMVDELAFLNGKNIENLPPLWSIGRGIYDLKAEYKKGKFTDLSI